MMDNNSYFLFLFCFILHHCTDINECHVNSQVVAVISAPTLKEAMNRCLCNSCSDRKNCSSTPKVHKLIKLSSLQLHDQLQLLKRKTAFNIVPCIIYYSFSIVTVSIF